MSEEMQNDNRNEYQKIYDDTNYFINAIVSDYGFYRDFIESIKSGAAEFKIVRKKIVKKIDDDWMDFVEENLPYLDKVIRSPSRSIEQKEEVKPIELSHNITSRSLQHLSQHTDYIKKIEGDMITPSKILNVYYDETLLTYENKFINTLVHRLYAFINKRYLQISANGGSEDSVSMDFSSDFKLGQSHGKIGFSVEVAEPNEKKVEGQSRTPSQRVNKLNEIAIRYMESDFVRSIGDNFVRPPIMRTNAITKNKDLKQCLLLWQFIESYDKVGYQVIDETEAEKPDDEYIKELYSTLALQYLMFRIDVSGGYDKVGETLNRKTGQTAHPVFRTELEDVVTDDYNVYDTEYRRVLTVTQAGTNKKLSDNELRIKKAIDVALEADKILTRKKLEEQKATERNLRKAKMLAPQRAGARDAQESAHKTKKQRLMEKKRRMKAEYDR